MVIIAVVLSVLGFGFLFEKSEVVGKETSGEERQVRKNTNELTGDYE